MEEVWSAFPHIEEARIRSVLGNFLFSGEDVLKKIAALSGGEKARVALAKLMLDVITSYSIHYTKLYDALVSSRSPLAPLSLAVRIAVFQTMKPSSSPLWNFYLS